jgi:hypothetical protein
MSALLDDAARAALIVAVGLLILAAVARGVLWARLDDARAQRLARQYVDPLCTWCFVALAVDLFALGWSNELGAGALAPPLIVGALAALGLWAGEPRAATPAAEAPAPTPAARPAAPAPARSLWAHHDDEDPARPGSLWSH